MIPSRRRHLLSFALASALAAAAGAQDDGDYPALLQDGERKLQKGQLSSAEARFQELLDAAAEEAPADQPAPALQAAARRGLFAIELRRGSYAAVRDGILALPAAEQRDRTAQLLLAQALAAVGDYPAAAARLQELVAADADDLQARHELGEVLWCDGRRAAAREQWQANVARPRPTDPLRLAFLGRSHWRLGGRQNFEVGSQALVDSIQGAPDRPEARTTLGLLKFEAYGEAMGFPSGEKDLAKVLETCGDDEAALLAMYRLRSANGALDPGKTERFLDRALAQNPRCTAALVERAANVLDDRRFQDAARLLDEALSIDPNHRLALCHRAAAAQLLQDAAGAAAFRERAGRGDPGWAEPDRILADHLAALYRFADAVPVYERALAASPDAREVLHGLAKALVYCGEGARAKELLLRAKAAEPGFVQPWRNNAIAVQELLETEYVVAEHGNFRFALHRDDAEVLRAYLLPLQLEAAEVLGAKYGYQPTRKVQVEVFHTWDDFSVRTIGFRGFTALGACFGGLITLVSPGDTDLRRQDFMWEATVWHEYTHVLTLGVSNHRVPRWLTEGFSVYEEKVRDPSWERGMDRELFDAYHNQDIPPVLLLNRLFRGPRILFGYYQGGLIVEWIARRHGFAKALELLRAFGEDLDTEAALQRALGQGAAQVDVELRAFIEQEKLRGMRLVPRFDDAAIDRLTVRAARDRTNLQARVDLAWAFLQRSNPVDAGRWLAEVLRADPEHAQAQLVRAALLASRGEREAALDCWRRGFAAGADDFDSRLRCGDALLAADDADGAIEQYQRAKACWPTCTEQENAPELRLARLFRDRGDRAAAQGEMRAYCQRTARAFTPRLTLAEFEREAGDRTAEVRYLVECNRIDPFHRPLHEQLGEAYLALGKRAQAALEFEVAAAVTADLDRRYQARGVERPAKDGPEEQAARAALWLRAAQLRHELGDQERARALLDRIQREAKDSPSAATAAGLQQEWQRK